VWEGQGWQHDPKVIEALRVSDEVRRRPVTPRTPRNTSPVVAPREPHLPPPPMASNEPKSQAKVHDVLQGDFWQD
jgi:hypothetical protein